MSSTKSSSNRVCVTCAFWCGARQPSTYRDRVEYDSSDDRGECAGGGYNRYEKSAGFSCADWEKWGALR